MNCLGAVAERYLRLLFHEFCVSGVATLIDLYSAFTKMLIKEMQSQIRFSISLTLTT